MKIQMISLEFNKGRMLGVHKLQGARVRKEPKEQCTAFTMTANSAELDGETGRTAAIRTAEEKTACEKVDRTNELSTNTTNDLGITTHHKETGHTFQFSDTRVLTYETNSHRRKLLEGLYIEANKEKLVNLKSGTRVDNCWTPLLSSIPSLTVL